MKKKIVLIIFTVILFSCSIEKLAYKMVGNALTGAGSSTVFTGETDPVLMAESLPLLLKVYETLLEKNQDNADLFITTGNMFIMYANAFVQAEAEKLPEDDYILYFAELDRAKHHYLRGRNYVLQGLDINYPGFIKAVNAGDYTLAFSKLSEKDADALYWAGAGWFGAIAIDIFDTSLSITVPHAVALLFKALELNESYGDGSIHEVFIQLYPSLPEYLLFSPHSAEDSWEKQFYLNYYTSNNLTDSTSLEKAEFHFNRAVELANGLHAGAFVSFAKSIAVNKNDPELYIEMLDAALSVDVDLLTSSRLANVIAQQSALRLKESIGDIFLID